MNNFLKKLKEEGILIFDIEVPESLTSYTLGYNIPISEGALLNQVEIDYRIVEPNFPYLELVKELIYKAAGSPSEIKNILFNTPDIIIQELPNNKILDWHHDAHTFEDGTDLKFEALLYISNEPSPNRHFYWKKNGHISINVNHKKIDHGTVIFINCDDDRYLHSAYGSDDPNEKIITLLLGCR